MLSKPQSFNSPVSTVLMAVASGVLRGQLRSRIALNNLVSFICKTKLYKIHFWNFTALL